METRLWPKSIENLTKINRTSMEKTISRLGSTPQPPMMWHVVQTLAVVVPDPANVRKAFSRKHHALFSLTTGNNPLYAHIMEEAAMHCAG